MGQLKLMECAIGLNDNEETWHWLFTFVPPGSKILGFGNGLYSSVDQALGTQLRDDEVSNEWPSERHPVVIMFLDVKACQ